ncbi:MAG: stage III sporulation protein AD, partial [Peptostreptococcales bacterium]
LVIFLMILKELEVVLAIITSISNQVSLSKIYFPVIFKILGVCYLADFTAQVCKDAGEGAIASKIEFAGKIIIVYLALPVFLSVIDLINNLLP